MTRLAPAGLVLDIDGTLVRGDRALPGAVEAVRHIQLEGRRVTFCTQE